MTVFDIVSLRVSFAVLACTLLVLFYVITYRSSRSAFAGWWCASLALFLCGTSGYLLNGTPHQVWANPLANALVVAGVGCSWAGSRSLRGVGMPWWWLAVAPTVVGLFSVVDDPADNIWAGGPYYLAAMWILLGLASVELGRLLRGHRFAESADGRSHRLSVWALLAASASVAVFYVGRWVAYLVVGPYDPPFNTVFGGSSTTLITTALLATVSFSMSTLSDEQQKEALRQLAARDGLTGLLNRTEFVRRAEEELRRTVREGGEAQVILADLDHFKRINDVHGHLAGDHALIAFANTCRNAVRSTDLLGRYGGEEFIMLLVGAGPERAEEVTATIRAALLQHARVTGLVLPTASFGISQVDGSLGLEQVDLEQIVERADRALYRAKAEGRDRTVHHTPENA